MAWEGLFEGSATASPSRSSAWGGLFENLPDVEIARRQRLTRYQAEEATSREAARKANSVVGILKAAGAAAGSTIPRAFQAGVEQTKSGVANLGRATTVPRVFEATAETAAGAAGVLGSPFAPIGEEIGKVIQAAGDRLANVAPIKKYGEAVARVPGYQPEEETATRLLTFLANVGAVADVLGVAKGVHGAVSRRQGAEAPEAARRLPVESEDTTTAVPVSTPRSRFEAYNREQGYEPYTPPDQLPVIPFGRPARPRSTEPSIEFGVPARTVRSRRTQAGDVVFEPIRPPVRPAGVPSTIESVYDAPVTRQAPVPPPRPMLGDERVTKAADDIAVELVERGFDRLPPEELARYTPFTKEAQVTRIAELMRNPEEAASMVRGEKPLPANVHEVFFFNAMKEYVRDTGNTPLLIEMAKSPLAERTSLAGQTLSAQAYSKIQYDPVETIRRVQKTRTETPQAKRRAKGTADRIRSNIRKENTATSWEAFIKSIEC